MLNVPILIVLLIGLIILSAFFSGSETGMMSLNRYRLRHMARKEHGVAKRVLQLLQRPDRLLGVILIGNTFANILASAIATMIAVHYFGDVGVVVSTVLLTLVILIFAETTPKTFAALHPERIAYFSSLTLKVLLKIFYPLVWLVNGVSNFVLGLLGIRVKQRSLEPLSVEELRTVVHEASGKISSDYQQMLLRILDLEQVTVEDVMVPRSEIDGIDLEDDWAHILKKLTRSEHAYLPVYRDNINQVQGILNLRKVLTSMQQKTMTKEHMIHLTDSVYFVPEGALASKQLLNFQQEQKSIGLVVDEYGDVQGLVSLQDILEEIVGEFALDVEDTARLLKKQKDGSYLVSGNSAVRELNRMTGWKLPTDGPKTLSGLVIEHLEMIPIPGVSARIAGYPMEVIQVSGNTIRQVRVMPMFYREAEQNQ